jgi:sec-independent protein translocase protein TatA
MSVGPFQIVIIALVLLVLFGRGRISDVMGDFGKGIKSFKQGISEAEQIPAATIDLQAAPEAQKADKHN